MALLLPAVLFILLLWRIKNDFALKKSNKKVSILNTKEKRTEKTKRNCCTKEK